MPFALKDVPATFQRLIDCVWVVLDGVELFVWGNNIIVYPTTLDEHVLKDLSFVQVAFRLWIPLTIWKVHLPCDESGLSLETDDSSLNLAMECCWGSRVAESLCGRASCPMHRRRLIVIFPNRRFSATWELERHSVDKLEPVFAERGRKRPPP